MHYFIFYGTFIPSSEIRRAKPFLGNHSETLKQRFFLEELCGNGVKTMSMKSPRRDVFLAKNIQGHVLFVKN